MTTYTIRYGANEFETHSPHVAESFSRNGAYVTAITQ